MSSVYVFLPVGKHLAGQHDQSDHGNWAHGTAPESHEQLMNWVEHNFDANPYPEREENQILERIKKFEPQIREAAQPVEGDTRTYDYFMSSLPNLAAVWSGIEDLGWHPMAKWYPEELRKAIDFPPIEAIDARTMDGWGGESAISYDDARDAYVVADVPLLRMNRGLRAGRKASAESKLCKMTDWAVQQLTARRPFFVSREAVLPESTHSQLREGTRYTDKGFQSTERGIGTTGYGTSRKRAGAIGDLVVNHIEIPKGAHVADFSYNEIVLPRNSTIEIVRRYVNPDGSIELWSRLVNEGDS